MTSATPRTRIRGPQKRAEETRRRLMEAGITAFSTVGYEGTSVVALETAARVKRGLLVYHFRSKEAVWRAVADELGARIEASLRRFFEVEGAASDPLERAIEAFIRANAETPELLRILIRDSEPITPRIAYLLDRNVRTFIAALEGIADRKIGVHDYYLFMGMTSFALASPLEARHIWGVDPLSNDFIAEQTRIVTALLRRHWNLAAI